MTSTGERRTETTQTTRDRSTAPPDPRAPLARRSLLTGGLGLVLSGCSVPDVVSVPGIISPEPEPVDVPPYQIMAGEVEPASKEAAVRALETALTWRDGEDGLEAATQRLAGAGVPSQAARPMARLYGGATWSSLRVVNPQYGGLIPDSAASVMVVAEQLRPGQDRPVARSVTADVRLVREADAWLVTDLLLPEPPPAAPAVSAPASAVLGHDRIVLPAAAQADVRSGRVDDAVLTMLVALADRWLLDVQVFATGHPQNVFGTDRESNHTRGRAVDVWAIDGIPVIDQGRSPWSQVMVAAAEQGANEIGGPADVDGVRGRPYFSDQLHQCHIHLGFDRA